MTLCNQMCHVCAAMTAHMKAAVEPVSQDVCRSNVSFSDLLLVTVGLLIWKMALSPGIFNWSLSYSWAAAPASLDQLLISIQQQFQAHTQPSPPLRNSPFTPSDISMLCWFKYWFLLVSICLHYLKCYQIMRESICKLGIFPLIYYFKFIQSCLRNKNNLKEKYTCLKWLSDMLKL